MISHRFSCSPRRLLDEIADDISSSLSLCTRRLRDESLGVSGVDLLEDENPPSLSRRLTAMKYHFTPLSGPKLSSTKSKERFVKEGVHSLEQNREDRLQAKECIRWSKTFYVVLLAVSHSRAKYLVILCSHMRREKD
ncbi:hypothetical protein DY000_02024163 [Brassica cretica]|uniref:Uncharacterized protein n=1 Tax=Brassica cretica TaxID=69181 RepID=A0ABQ7E408_BRACR|nr:hypothetical protein DY000_02024163 [Brassica cretica]